VAQVLQYLASLPAMDRPWLVEFYPGADSLFFRDVESERVAIWQRYSYPGTPDLYIIHLSRYLPEDWGEWIGQVLRVAHIDPEQGTGLLFHRDGTESWYVGSGGRAPGEAVLP
jgi:hypothetical protein